MAELQDDATHEDIEKYVDEVVSGVEADREGTTDSQKVASETDEPVGDMTAEGSDDTASDGEDSGDWITDDLKAEVAAYGIDEAQLEDFSSREELDRAMRFFDKTALEAGRKAMAEGESKEEKTEEVKIEPKEGQYEISLDANVYDEDLVGEFTRMRDHYESRLEALESRFQEADARAEEQRFDSLVDSLGHADLFGKSGKENSKQLQRRQDLFVAAKAQQIGLAQLGRDVDLDETLVNRVARMVFAEDLGKKDLKAWTRKVSEQSESRQGGTATRSQPEQPESVRDEMRQLYKELERA